jgi:hypothetical protein
MSPDNSSQRKEGKKRKGRKEKEERKEGRKKRRNTETESQLVQLFHFMTGHNTKASK